MSLRLLVDDKVVYEGEAIAVPRVGEAFQGDGDAVPVESVTWDFRSAGTVSVTLGLAARPYTY